MTKKRSILDNNDDFSVILLWWIRSLFVTSKLNELDKLSVQFVEIGATNSMNNRK